MVKTLGTYAIYIYLLGGILITLLMILCKLYISKSKQKDISHIEDPDMIKLLKEVAYDYKVKIFKNGYGNLIFSEMMNQNDFGWFEKDSQQMRGEFTDEGNVYLIAFRVVGKEFIGYGSNEVKAWSAVVKKAREENLKFFSKSSYYDRQRL